MRLLSVRRAWPCIDGPLAGATIAVSRLAAWTGYTEARATVVQPLDGSPARFAGGVDGKAAAIIVGHYGQHGWHRAFHYEPSTVAPVYDTLARDHRTPLGWMERVGGASWNYRAALDVNDHHFGRRVA